MVWCAEQLWNFLPLIPLLHFPKFFSCTAVPPHAVLLDVAQTMLLQVPNAVPLGVAQYIVPGHTCCSTWCCSTWYCSRFHNKHKHFLFLHRITCLYLSRWPKWPQSGPFWEAVSIFPSNNSNYIPLSVQLIKKKQMQYAYIIHSTNAGSSILAIIYWLINQLQSLNHPCRIKFDTKEV